MHNFESEKKASFISILNIVNVLHIYYNLQQQRIAAH